MMLYDLAVIGGGTAGLVASRTAASLGARVILIERDRLGGDCLWTGCVPSKSLIAAATLAHQMRRADALGLDAHEPSFSFSRVMERVRAAQAQIEPADSREALEHDGVEVLHGAARFTAPGRIDVDGRTVACRTALIATGSRPLVPPIEGLAAADPLTNETVWDLREQPRRLAILGGGPIGCELGQAFQRLGSEVTIVEQLDGLLPKEEPNARLLIEQLLRGEGVELLLGVKAGRVDGQALVLADGARVEFDRILVATGRRPAADDLGLEAIGVERDERGAVKVDGRLATSARNVYAAGDVTGALPFTHVAGYHARTVVANALFKARTTVDYASVPWVTFTDPEVARVGLTEAQARERFDDAKVVYEGYGSNDRAITAAATPGFAQLVGDRKGRLVGATVVGQHAGESIAELAAWIRAGGKIDDVSRTVHAYPTFSEGQARAADRLLMERWFNPRVRRFTRPALALLRRLDRP
jgi:pyruvate/2-oxoglutarate dehydrogenase complex dihydrolipoamide dehydrogenase (E3) component